MPTNDELRTLQALPLDIKILKTKQRIKEWYDHWDGQVYISFSGGKDSTVLLDIARSIYADLPAVFIDTGLEYPEISSFVKTFDNVTWVKPEMNFKKVLEHYGYPFVSKEVGEKVFDTRVWLSRQPFTWSELLDARNHIKTDGKMAYAIVDFLGIDRRTKGNEEYKQLKEGVIPMRAQLLAGINQNPKTGKSSKFNCKKWAFLIEAPFVVSNRCCDVMKKRPALKYSKESGRKPITGQMAEESRLRRQKWLNEGCNLYTGRHPVSNPMSFWTEQDVLSYIKLNDLPIASVYGEIVNEKDQVSMLPDETPRLKTTGCSRTGCVYCGFGCHLEKEENSRFLRLKDTHPQIYDYIMKPTDQGGLGYKDIIDWLNEHGNLHIRY